MKPFQAHGVIVPTLTPFSPGGEQIDEGAFVALNGWLIERGVAGLMPCGTTGEGMLLTTAERRHLLELTVQVSAGRVEVMAHVGAISTAETIGLAQHAVACGADAISVVTPYYYSLGSEDIIEHFCSVAEAVPQMPVFLYNIPQCTINRITLPIVQAVIARCPNVLGIKDSSGDLLAISQYVDLRDGAFQVMNGHDGALLPALKLGARGCVSGNSNVVPELVCAVTDAWAAGDAAWAAAAFERMSQARELLAGSIALLKHGLNLRGLLGGDVRPPQGPAPKAAVERVEGRLLGLVG